MSKILFTDLDETLLNTDKTICEENKEAIKLAVERGHKIVLTSGRSVHGEEIVLEQLFPSDSIYMICFQGGLGMDRSGKNIIFNRSMDGKIAAKIQEKAAEAGIYAHTFTTDGLRVPEENGLLESYIKITGEKYEVFSSADYFLDKAVYKTMAICAEEDKLYRLKDVIENSYLGDEVEAFFSTTYFLEFVKKGINKGQGILDFAEAMNCPVSDTIAVGDERNDLSMIKTAGIGCAMANARPELKEIADYITVKDNNQGGLAEVIHKFLL